MKKPTWLPESWLPIGFMIALACTAVAFAGGRSSFQNDWFCLHNESIAECARNWVNASGNLALVIATTFAAIFAFRQWQSSKKQAEIALEPTLRGRIASLYALRRYTNAMFGAYMSVINELSFLLDAVHGRRNWIDIWTIIENIRNMLVSYEKARQELINFVGTSDPHEDLKSTGVLFIVSTSLGEDALKLISLSQRLNAFSDHKPTLDAIKEVPVGEIFSTAEDTMQVGRKQIYSIDMEVKNLSKRHSDIFKE